MSTTSSPHVCKQVRQKNFESFRYGTTLAIEFVYSISRLLSKLKFTSIVTWNLSTDNLRARVLLRGYTQWRG